MRLPDFLFDRLSFWLGFAAATILWWVLGMLRPMLPRWRNQIRQAVKDFHQRNLAGAETNLLRETQRRAQRMHLAMPLFSLDEILVTPRLIAPPPQISPDQTEIHAIPISSQVLPYLPDWPELTAPLGVPTITVLEALQKGSHIAIIGQPGSGKTVALAHLASQLSKPSEAKTNENQARLLPLYLHVLDLDTTLVEDRDPLENLSSAVIHLSSLVAQPQITRFMQTVFDSRTRGQWKPILILDGLDELPKDEMLLAARYLRALLRSHPEFQAVVAASGDYIDGLTRSGFVPLGIASWTAAQRAEFLDRWGSLWVNQFLPEIKKQIPQPDIEPLLIFNWLRSEISSDSPLEWTLKVWAAYAGDLNESGAAPLLETFIHRHLAVAYRAAVNDLAHKMIVNNTTSMNFDEMEEILSGMPVNEPPSAMNDILEEGEAILKTGDQSAGSKLKHKFNKEAAIVSQGERIAGVLLNAGLMVRHPGGKMRFINPVVLGYLSGPHLTNEEAGVLAAQPEWSAGLQALRFLGACSAQAPWLAPMLQTSTAPLHRSLLAVARWLQDVPSRVEWRALIMRQLVNLIQNESLPMGARARFAAAFVASRDPSSVRLFRQLLTSRSATVRKIALVSCSALGETAAMNDMLELLADPDITVRNTACISIGTLPGDQPVNTIVAILMESDEEMRQVAAEALALRPPEGHKLLEEASQSDDILTRRAAISGLLQIRESWARLLLEKIAVEDSQWIVRNAASHALDVFDQPTPFVPQPLPAPSECPWLITFASRLGLGILPDRPATDVLLAALKSGSFEERAGALDYLRNEPSEAVIDVVMDSIYSNQEEMREPALNALWWVALSGAKIPDSAHHAIR